MDISLSGNNFELRVEKIEISGNSGVNVFTLIGTQVREGVSIKHLVDPEDDHILITISINDGTIRSYEFGVDQAVIEL